MDMDTEQGAIGGGPKVPTEKAVDMLPPAKNLEAARSSPEPNVKVKLTPCGLTFSGPTTFPSNMHRADFVFEGQPYSSSEQGIQHLNAKHHKMPEIAAKILATHDAKTIKDISHDIPKSAEWKKIAPSKLWGLIDAKFTQNPTLMKQLLETAPHKLVEASMDGYWGGVPLMELTLMNMELYQVEMYMEKWPPITGTKNLPSET